MKKRNNGFSLIELLAVLVLVAIITLIAVPVIGYIINEAKQSIFKSTVNNVIQEIEDECRNDLVEKNTAKKVYKFYKNGVSPSIDIDGNIPTNGSIELDNECKVKSVNVSDESFVAVLDSNNKIKVSKNNTKPAKEGLYNEQWTYEDSNSNSLIDVGDTIKVESENFYILSNDGVNIKAISKYGMSSDSGNTDSSFKQSTDYNSCHKTSLAREKYYFDNYKKKLEVLGVDIINISSISLDEMVKLGCVTENYNKEYTCDRAVEFIKEPSFWTSTLFDISNGRTEDECINMNVHSINSQDNETQKGCYFYLYQGSDSGLYRQIINADGYYSTTNPVTACLRPVITISTSDINPVIK